MDLVDCDGRTGWGGGPWDRTENGLETQGMPFTKQAAGGRSRENSGICCPHGLPWTKILRGLFDRETRRNFLVLLTQQGGALDGQLHLIGRSGQETEGDRR